MKTQKDRMVFKEKHGEHGTRLYNIWSHMKTRCLDPQYKAYSYYGGRGISVCDAWKNSFSEFSKWAKSNGYSSELTLERIDVNGNYEPSNCRWATRKEQNRNMRSTRMLTFGGETLCLEDMATKYGVNKATLARRLQRGWSLEDAIVIKPGEKRGNITFITFRGLTLPLTKMAKHYGIKAATLCVRLKRGWSLEDALTKQTETKFLRKCQ